jgi:hypothetical protein
MKDEEKYKWIDEISKIMIESSKYPSEAQKATAFSVGLYDTIGKIWQSGYDECKEEFVKNAKNN